MWSLVKHQLENARLLATHYRGRPRQATLRRAVSTAYYAVFQALCVTCAETLVGEGKPWGEFTPGFRALEHGHVAHALRQPSLATDVRFPAPRAGFQRIARGTGVGRLQSRTASKNQRRRHHLAFHP